MSRTWWLAFALLAMGTWMGACGSSTPTPVQQAGVGAWGADDAVCITNGTTKASVDKCRDELRTLFCGADGGILADSGGCANVTLSDGGKP